METLKLAGKDAVVIVKKDGVCTQVLLNEEYEVTGYVPFDYNRLPGRVKGIYDEYKESDIDNWMPVFVTELK